MTTAQELTRLCERVANTRRARDFSTVVVTDVVHFVNEEFYILQMRSEIDSTYIQAERIQMLINAAIF